ncbi:N-acetylglucosamine-6-phosphate deacetylase [Roseibium denhamense]|uniref:N-acetylglucosamine 6-phosphate deacetylase n=1 Tax=Roseibium denhamense TaxID=76305 RepID=A0ABY1NGV3_9HYPH|nr:N-acetylglucosamine-6-phosphate deacetylase [Roseibium denhamense]MTI06456.1 N-acetylglucosamine-6-phosphate deacetylase [Roseibium denhamense]SMP09287.1 N-acetylglucosamine 6-phosphate deacetylase [Roseibium denhamense]
MQQVHAFQGARIFDGMSFQDDAALCVHDGKVVRICATADLPEGAEVTDLGGGILAPGFVDLQVNGGGGVMFNSAPALETLKTIAEAHASIGATSILPTLITDTRETTAAAIQAVQQAISEGVPGIAGLHLEGPHLSVARKGAHDADLIRPMEPADLESLLAAAKSLPVLKVTVAPESVKPEQIRALSAAGILVSLGHTDSRFADCQEAVAAGARCVTHLFNAQSQLGNREPGVVGAALQLGDLSAGLIADGIHVHPATMASAIRAKQGPGHIFLVSDAMATAGSTITDFLLNGRKIERRDNRLTLQDGTLAGAHLDLTTAIRNLVHLCGIPLETALAMATSGPAALIGRSEQIGTLRHGANADFVHLSSDLELRSVFRAGLPG